MNGESYRSGYYNNYIHMPKTLHFFPNQQILLQYIQDIYKLKKTLFLFQMCH